METNIQDQGNQKPPSIGFFAYFAFFFGLLGPIVLALIILFWILNLGGGGLGLSGALLLGSFVYVALLVAGVIILFIGIFGLAFGFAAKKLAKKNNYENPFISSSIYLGYFNIILAIIYYVVFFFIFHGII